MADLVGRDAASKLLGLGTLQSSDLRQGSLGEDLPTAEATVRVGAPLSEAFSALADARAAAVPVLDGDRTVGVLDADGVLRALRRIVDERAPEESAAV